MDLLKISDCFVLASRSEGLNNSLLEACVSGLPIVATRVGGNSEIINNSDCGILIDSSDMTGLTQAILWMVRNKNSPRKMGDAARKRIEKYFSLDVMLQSYAKKYRSVAGIKN